MTHPVTRQIEKAEEAANAYRASRDLDEAEDAWCEFLHHFVRAVNKYDAYGRAGYGKSWTLMRIVLRSDDWLVYLWEARNVDEHSIREVAGRTTGATLINPIAIDVGDGLVVDGSGNVGILIEPNIGLTFVPGNLHTVAIRGRDGAEYRPPLHAGFPMPPLELMEYGVTFLRQAIS